MTFVSYAFVLVFLVAIAGRLILGRTSLESGYLRLLLVCSLVFYAWLVPAYLFILLASTWIDFQAAKRMGELPPSSTRRSSLLAISVTANLSVLGFFKYYEFGVDSLDSALALVHLGSSNFPHLNLLLPVGISFYTFQSMSYTIDVYRGRLEPIRSSWRFLLFVSFFPQLVAGPIVRASEFFYQLDRARRPRLDVWLQGGWLIIRGFFLKMVVADNIGLVVDRHWQEVASPGGSATVALVVVVLFSCQIFGDFAGYSSIARGVAYLLGFRLPVNFKAPYLARSFSEFWTRWHITLSSWLRDYLYIPLGGNRISRARTYLNLMIVMLLGGLWHGASITFVLWGGLHGLALVVERLLGLNRKRSTFLSLAWLVITQGVVLLAWVLFRSRSLAEAAAVFENAFSGRGAAFVEEDLLLGLLYVLPIALLHGRTALEEQFGFRAMDGTEKSFWAGIMVYLIFACNGETVDFIYFQF